MVQSLLTQLVNARVQARNIDALLGDAYARIEDLEDHVSRLENDLADARKEARG
jgi:hypothetical protein